MIKKKRNVPLYDVDCHSRNDGLGAVDKDSALAFIQKANNVDALIMPRYLAAIDSLELVGDKIEIGDFTIELVEIP